VVSLADSLSPTHAFSGKNKHLGERFSGLSFRGGRPFPPSVVACWSVVGKRRQVVRVPLAHARRPTDAAPRHAVRRPVLQRQRLPAVLSPAGVESLSVREEERCWSILACVVVRARKRPRKVPVKGWLSVPLGSDEVHVFLAFVSCFVDEKASCFVDEKASCFVDEEASCFVDLKTHVDPSVSPLLLLCAG